MTRKILIAIGSGIAVGLFVGEPAGHLKVVGDVFVGLLQMTVLPFIVVSLAVNIGRFSLDEGRALAKWGSLVLALLFMVSLGALVILPLSFPTLESGAFFSDSLVETRARPDFLALYIPSNPFYSLSSNLVPATVVFSLMLGVALTGLERKDKLLEVLDVLIKALARMNSLVVRQMPYGVFAIAASAAGTMTVEEFGRLQAYLLAHTAGALLMTFGVLPMLVSVLTSIEYRKILSVSRDFLLTAWATGSLFAVLPMLIEAIDRLLEEEGWSAKRSSATPGVLVPLGYPFPTVGKLLALLFVPFVGWFLGQPFGIEEYALFLPSGLFASFGSLVVTIPFLLELLRLPSDFFNLFLMAGVWSARLGDLAGGMHLLAFSVLTMAGLSGQLRFRPRRIVAHLTVLAVVTGLFIVGARSLLLTTFAGDYTLAETVTELHRGRADLTPTVLAEATPNPSLLGPDQNRLERIRARGILRVGFVPDRLPYSFVNAEGDVVGFDIDMVRELQKELEVDLELVPYAGTEVAEGLASDHFDLAIGGVVGMLHRAEQMLLTEPYMLAHVALLVPDHRRRELDTLDELRRMGSELAVAAVAGSYSAGRGMRLLPHARRVEIDSEPEFFGLDDVDALVTTAEGGSAWTLIYPRYTIVLPITPIPKVPLVIAVAGRDQALGRYLDRFIAFHRAEGTLDGLFEKWIQGEDSAKATPRWSIGRDILHLWR